MKEPESAAFVPWHQDATYFGLAPHEQVTAWVALTDSNRENGCVQVLPGSHQFGQRPHKDQADERVLLSRGQTLTDALDETKAVDLLLTAGEISFHHTLLMHRSLPNLSHERRIGIGISYIPATVRHLGETPPIGHVGSWCKHPRPFRFRTPTRSRRIRPVPKKPMLMPWDVFGARWIACPK